MTRERVNQIINFAENLNQDPDAKQILKGAIKNVQRLQHEGEEVKRTLHLLEQVRRVSRSMPQPGNERNN